METELKSCPFCGSSVIALRKMPWKWVGEELWECKCKQCGVRMGLQYSKKKAIEAWNRRTPAIVKVETSFYDKEEIYPDCTVQVLTNTKTGETSVGWWKNGNET